MKNVIDELRTPLTVPLLLIAGIFCVGVVGYLVIGWGRWSVLECAYMTLITLTTVGYGDVLHIEGDTAATLFTMAILLVGMGVVLYSVSTITAFVVEGGVATVFRERKMLSQIQRLRGHIIVAGAGATGENVVDELVHAACTFVVVESEREALEGVLQRHGDILALEGDATEDETLVRAGICHAGGLIACLSNDKDNLYLTVTAKNLNPGIRVVARAIAKKMREKLLRVGADCVVSPNQIGGLRMASEILRPHVVSFLDRMLRSKQPAMRFAEVEVGEGSALDGQTLAGSRIYERTGLLVVAALPRGASEHLYNLPGTYRIERGSVLIVIGDLEAVRRLERMAGGGGATRFLAAPGAEADAVV